MITQQFASVFAQDWVDSWNALDLDRIMDHYTEDFEMSSPFIEIMGLGSAGTLKGRDIVRDYWSKALSKYHDLHLSQTECSFQSIRYVSIISPL
jgi:ketosteroid isomerase-like protein